MVRFCRSMAAEPPYRISSPSHSGTTSAPGGKSKSDNKNLAKVDFSDFSSAVTFCSAATKDHGRFWVNDLIPHVTGRKATIQRFAHTCFRKLGSICISGGVILLMKTGRSVCDLNRHTLSLFNTHSLIKSATIGGVD